MFVHEDCVVSRSDLDDLRTRDCLSKMNDLDLYLEVVSRSR